VAEPSAAAVPAGHGVQEVEPAPEAKVPAGQVLQNGALVALEKWPGSQAVHMASPPEEALPAAQGRQLVAPAGA